MEEQNAQDWQRPHRHATPTAVQVSQLLILHMKLRPDTLNSTESIFKTHLCLSLMVTVCCGFVQFDLAGFKIVTSGRECQRISSTEMCKKAFKMLDLKISGDPWVGVSNYGSSRPKGCFTNSARNKPYLNTVAGSSSAAECSLNYPCICYDIDCTTTRSTGKWEFVWRE